MTFSPIENKTNRAKIKEALRDEQQTVISGKVCLAIFLIDVK